jgi:polyhydroxybutyrate depolymerase
MTLRTVFLLGIILLAPRSGLAAEWVQLSWKVDGVTREARVHVPAKPPTTGAPLVFVFHGHGGSMHQAGRSMPIHEKWPEAIVVYPQGLPTAGQLTDKAGSLAGWQGKAGTEGDRDLKFFDVMWADLQTWYKPDLRRIYATGHSNGGGFTYLLWAERGDVFAALAPSSALLARGFNSAKAKPVLHIASSSDPLVKFSWQERMLEQVLRLNGCEAFKPSAMGYTVYPSKTGNDVGVYLHDGGHRYPSKVAPDLIVKFFQEHVRP